MISILIANDYPIIRSGLKLIINEQDDMKVIQESTNGEEAVYKALKYKPDVVLMDILLPKKNGIWATQKILEQDEDIKILALSTNDKKENMFKMLQAGALGYFSNLQSVNELVEGIRTIHTGKAFLNPKFTRLLLEDYKQLNCRANKRGDLTEREIEVLTHLVKGFTSKEVAELLNLSVKTIETHRYNIMRKLNIHHKHELIEYAMNQGYVNFINQINL